VSGWRLALPSAALRHLSTWRASRWGRRLALAAGLLLAGLSIAYVAPRFAEGVRSLDPAVLSRAWAPLAISVALTILCVLLGGVIWRLILAGLGYPLDWRRCLSMHTTSNLAGYVPGYAWKYLGKAYLTTQAGVPAAAVGTALGLEFGGLLLTGGVVALATVPDGFVVPALGAVPTAAARLAALAGTAGLVAAPWAARAWLQRMSRPARVRSLYLGIALVAMLGSWLTWGIAFGYLVSALAPLPAWGWGVSVFALAVSYIATLVAFFVPGGLGVREGIMVYTLGVVIAPGLAATAAVAARFTLLASEVLACGLMLALQALGWARRRVYNR
jgi:hypothetical protein